MTSQEVSPNPEVARISAPCTFRQSESSLPGRPLISAAFPEPLGNPLAPALLTLPGSAPAFSRKAPNKRHLPRTPRGPLGKSSGTPRKVVGTSSESRRKRSGNLREPLGKSSEQHRKSSETPRKVVGNPSGTHPGHFSETTRSYYRQKETKDT